MTTHERIGRVYDHREPDRVPITDRVWESTWVRWRREGLPERVSVTDYFGWDLIVNVGIDPGPRFERKVIEETDSYRIERDALGQTHKNFKPCNTTPEYIDSIVKDPASWQIAKKRMTLSRDRVNWKALEANYATWRRDGAWVVMTPHWSFDYVSTRMCNSEIVLYAMADNPAWVRDMCETGADLAIQLMDLVVAEGYEVDEVFWYDDMSYRNGLMFSKAMWREMIRPYQKRYIDWAHAHGAKANLHCCGRITELLPDLIELGLDALDPLEVKAGMEPLQTKKRYGSDLVLRGGFDIQNWSDPVKAEEDIRRVLPAMMQSGGYIFASDHSVADSVSLQDYRHIVSLAREIGTYS